MYCCSSNFSNLWGYYSSPLYHFPPVSSQPSFFLFSSDSVTWNDWTGAQLCSMHFPSSPHACPAILFNLSFCSVCPPLFLLSSKLCDSFAPRYHLYRVLFPALTCNFLQTLLCSCPFFFLSCHLLFLPPFLLHLEGIFVHISAKSRVSAGPYGDMDKSEGRLMLLQKFCVLHIFPTINLKIISRQSY